MGSAAEGPLTPNLEPLNEVTTIPPIIPETIPVNAGAPETSAIPKQSGSATSHTTILAGMSFFKFLPILLITTNNLSVKKMFKTKSNRRL